MISQSEWRRVLRWVLASCFSSVLGVRVFAEGVTCCVFLVYSVCLLAMRVLARSQVSIASIVSVARFLPSLVEWSAARAACIVRRHNQKGSTHGREFKSKKQVEDELLLYLPRESARQSAAGVGLADYGDRLSGGIEGGNARRAAVAIGRHSTRASVAADGAVCCT